MDLWCGASTLKERFPLIFAICDDTDAMVAQVLAGAEVNIRLRRSLDQVGRLSGFCAEVGSIQLSQGKDKIGWPLDPTGRYSVSSMYEKLSRGATVAHATDVWKAAVPHKINIFAWQLTLDKLPSNIQIATGMVRLMGHVRCVEPWKTRHTSSLPVP
jgi:hypothetical protein